MFALGVVSRYPAAVVAEIPWVVGIDEVQFLSGEIIPLALELVHLGKRVILDGLDTTFANEPFGPVPNLMALADEVTKREKIYADFLESASKLLLNAYMHDDIVLGVDEQHLLGLINRMRLFAPPEVVGYAEAAFKAIVEVLLKPSIEMRQFARDALTKSPEPDPFLKFSLTCRADLDHVRRTLR